VPGVQVKLPDGSVRQVPAGTTPAELLDTADAVAALVDGEPWDLGRGLGRDATVVALPAASEQGRTVVRHSAAHVLAQAVTDLYSEAKYAIGPSSRPHRWSRCGSGTQPWRRPWRRRTSFAIRSADIGLRTALRRAR
jgi:hypothetical protein